MTIEPAVVAVVLCSLAVGLAVLGRAWPAVRRTTLAGPWFWAAISLLGWAGAELVVELSVVSGTSAEAVRFAAVALSFCPVVAILGAKRPQHVAWNLVVVSLWAMVALPAAENFFLRPGHRLSLGDARAWFLWVLIALGPINYVPTRFRVAATLLAAGQIMALAPYLALLHRPLAEKSSALGLVLVIAGLLAAWFASRRSKPVANELDRVWLDFRDAFGLLWALRLQERMNAVAQQNGWNVELSWDGFRYAGEDPGGGDGEKVAERASGMERALRTTMNGVLRRFW